MATAPKPRVYISYTWQTPGLKDRAFELAERLRKAGADSRIDLYFTKSLHGFLPPDAREGDDRPPWMIWQEDEIRGANAVILICTPEYAERVESHPQSGAWWDVEFMRQDLNSGRVQRRKFIPVGYGPYGITERYIPAFLQGAHYYDLGSPDGFEDLLRRLQTEFGLVATAERQASSQRAATSTTSQPGDTGSSDTRAGIFVSYSHKNKKWLERLLEHLAVLRSSGVKIWTDQDIEPGESWQGKIEEALDHARIAVLLVTPAFFASTYIANNELPNLLSAAESKGLTVFWIPVSDSQYAGTEIAKFQAAHPPTEPLDRLKPGERNTALVRIADKLKSRLSR